MERVYIPVAKVAGAVSLSSQYLWRHYFARSLAGSQLSLGAANGHSIAVYLSIWQLFNQQPTYLQK